MNWNKMKQENVQSNTKQYKDKWNKKKDNVQHNTKRSETK